MLVGIVHSRYGQGKEVGEDTFETRHGVDLFFYDADSIKAEFGNYDLIDAEIMNEPVSEIAGKAPQSFWYIVCKKSEELRTSIQ